MITRPARRSLLLTAALIAGTLTGLSLPATADATTPQALGQHIAVPAYIPPSSSDWNKLETASPTQLGFVVANVANGPDAAVNSQWQAVINATHNHGSKVLGYVDSGYFGYSADHRTTISGDTDPQAWLVQAEQQVNTWYQLYGSSVDGIFFDDGENVCGPTAGDNTYVNLYRQLNTYVHTYHPGALTVVNPGVAVPQCYEDAADVIVTFEGSYSDLMNPPAPLATQTWQLNADPNKFWSIVYGVPDQTSLTAVMNKTKQNNAGYVYATDDTLPNPYDTVPNSTYFNSELAAAMVTDTQTPVIPPRPYTTALHSSTVDIGWTSTGSSTAVGYDVLVNGKTFGSVGNFTPQDTDFHLVGLTPGTTYNISVKSRDTAGTLSAASPALSVTTETSFGAAPTAPTALTQTALSANSVRLAWGASTDFDQYVAQYEVMENGVRQVTLDPNTRAIRLEFLKPGTTYIFTVIARDNTGTPSPASNSVTVTTPNPTPIASPAGTFTATTATFQAQFNVNYQFHHVFISDGANQSTGYAINGIVADFLFEEGTFFHHDPTQPGAYAWIPFTAPAGAPFLSSTTGGLYVWQTPTSNLTPGATSLQAVFDGSGGGSPEVTLAPITITQH